MRGQVLPIGGLKEKLLAARRGGIKTVIIPQENERDLTEIPDTITDELDIIPVQWIEQVLDIALQYKPEPIDEKEVGDGSDKTKKENPNSLRTH